MMGLQRVLAAGLLGMVLSLAVTPLAAWLARRLSILDRPGGYKGHESPTPLLGGVAIGLATFVVALGMVPAGEGVGGLAALGAGAAVILGGGLVDDVRAMSPGPKFLWQLAAVATAGLLLTLYGVRLSLFLYWSQPFMVLLTVVWILTITNAVNFQDNMNGLCAGLGFLAAGALSAINLRTGEVGVAVVAAALAGACLGFLPYNWPRARIFLGDAGSMLIGFLLAALSVMGVYTREAGVPELAVYAPLLVLALPVLDLGAVVFLRSRLGRPAWWGDRRHLSHRLVRRGFRPTAAVAVLWAAAAATALGAAYLPRLPAGPAVLLLALLLLMLAGLAAAAGSRGLDD